MVWNTSKNIFAEFNTEGSARQGNSCLEKGLNCRIHYLAAILIKKGLLTTWGVVRMLRGSLEKDADQVVLPVVHHAV